MRSETHTLHGEMKRELPSPEKRDPLGHPNSKEKRQSRSSGECLPYLEGKIGLGGGVKKSE